LRVRLLPSADTGKEPTLREGVAVFRDPVDGRLFMLGSHLSGWEANGAMLFVSSQHEVCGTNSTPWAYIGNPAVGPGNGSTFASQATFVMPWNASMAVAGRGDAGPVACSERDAGGLRVAAAPAELGRAMDDALGG